MSTIINPTINDAFLVEKANPSLFGKFIAWCIEQNESRLLWVGIALAGHGCVLTPLTVLAVGATGADFTLIMFALAAMAMALIVNLAALPTKITIPVLLLSVVVDVAVVIAAIAG